jgi:hypothetical protein
VNHSSGRDQPSESPTADGTVDEPTAAGEHVEESDVTPDQQDTPQYSAEATIESFEEAQHQTPLVEVEEPWSPIEDDPSIVLSSSKADLESTLKQFKYKPPPLPLPPPVLSAGEQAVKDIENARALQNSEYPNWQTAKVKLHPDFHYILPSSVVPTSLYYSEFTIRTALPVSRQAVVLFRYDSKELWCQPPPAMTVR